MGTHGCVAGHWTRTPSFPSTERMTGAFIILVLHLTGSLGNNIADPEVVFIGPGDRSDGLSEVLLLPSLTPGASTPPLFPHGEYSGYVGRLSPDGPQLCGGSVSGVEQSACHLLDRNGSWVSAPQMTVERDAPAAVQLGESWWVTGGVDAADNTLSSTELLTGNTWLSSTDLPTPLSAHCMVKINSSHVFIAGGADANDDPTAASYLFSSTTGSYTRQPDMIIPRSDHACELVNNAVWVAGGENGDDDRSAEYFSLASLSWSMGPFLPSDVHGGRMMKVDEELLLFGDSHIWQLETTGLDYWDQVGEMETDRGHFDILRMKLSDCITWNMQL